MYEDGRETRSVETGPMWLGTATTEYTWKNEERRRDMEQVAPEQGAKEKQHRIYAFASATSSPMDLPRDASGGETMTSNPRAIHGAAHFGLAKAENEADDEAASAELWESLWKEESGTENEHKRDMIQAGTRRMDYEGDAAVGRTALASGSAWRETAPRWLAEWTMGGEEARRNIEERTNAETSQASLEYARSIERTMGARMDDVGLGRHAQSVLGMDETASTGEYLPDRVWDEAIDATQGEGGAVHGADMDAGDTLRTPALSGDERGERTTTSTGDDMAYNAPGLITQRVDETRAQFLTRAKYLEITPPPANRYPAVTAKTSLDHFRCFPPTKVTEFLNKPDGTTCVIDVYGLGRANAAQLREIGKSLRTVLKIVTGSLKLQLVGPTPRDEDDVEWDPPTCFLASNLGTGAQHVLCAQGQWDNDILSFRALKPLPPPPSYLFTRAVWALRDDQALVADILEFMKGERVARATKLAIREDALPLFASEDEGARRTLMTWRYE
ncbi:hypothetical protein C2E23DRAFT_860271 [Lenzites betulinus]|nr:hypothetical protein C2E23DRAFT_860271 [Lenzites betulinus]